MKKTNFFSILTIGISFYCYEFFLRILTGAYQEQIVNYFSINTHTGFSFLVSSYNITYLLMQIPAGILLDRFGSKKILISATLICGLGNILFVLGSYNMALVGRLLVGIGSSFAFIGVLKLARENLSLKYFGLVASIVISLGTLAAAFSQQLSVYISSYNASWISVFIYSGILAVPLSLLFLLFLPSNENTINLMPKIGDISNLTKKLLKDKTLWLNASWASLIYIPTVVLTSQYGVFYFKSIYNINDLSGTTLITSLFMGWVIFSPIMATIIHKFGERKTIHICIIGMLITIILLDAKVLGNNLILLTFLFGSFSAVQVLVWHFFNKICPTNISGLGIAITNMIITLITELGQLAVGVSLDVTKVVNLDYPSKTISACFLVFTLLGYYLIIKSLKKFDNRQIG
ncbi:MFS transporter [Francisella frigiditurris]|uniref:Lysosomal dipeptide transporter MFSD1 n=1 Tax=Francisella frigiditurris TaxID=1542390 RepID=A0A1J0KTB5_9GAMM|nr:MFS transporter [Francisella frigiditurris]APC97001.1 sugar (and other) transporter family protein [Francisella frigiditurris]